MHLMSHYSTQNKQATNMLQIQIIQEVLVLFYVLLINIKFYYYNRGVTYQLLKVKCIMRIVSINL